jgi:hypothetical protein
LDYVEEGFFLLCWKKLCYAAQESVLNSLLPVPMQVCLLI